MGNLFSDHGLDVLAPTETWHDRSSDVCLSAIIPSGGSIVEQARPVPAKAVTMDNSVNHGGIACLARGRIKLRKIDIPDETDSFEMLCVFAYETRMHQQHLFYRLFIDQAQSLQIQSLSLKYMSILNQ